MRRTALLRRIAAGAALALCIAGCATAVHNGKPVVALIGDSTVTTEKGWGGAFTELLEGRAEVYNFAVGGRSAKSYTDENRLPAALAVEPDYVFIQFGHNGQPGKGAYRETDPEDSYRDYLRQFVLDIRAAGAEPVIVSSLTRRHFDNTGHIDSTLGPWADGARAVADEQGVTFVDLHAASSALHDRIGEKASSAFDFEPGDRTHLNDYGARQIAGLILDLLAEIGHPLGNAAPES